MPRTAVAAATGTDTRWVRPPLPCRPSKLRLEVEALRSCGASWSGFMPRHIEQPGAAPLGAGLLEDHVEALLLGLQPDPDRAGDDEQPGVGGDLAALDDLDAASRRSSIRPLVQEPTKTVSTLDVAHRGPGLETHVGQRLLGGDGVAGLLEVRRRRDGAAERDALAGVGAPGDERRHLGGVEHDLLVERRVVVGAQAASSARPRRPSRRPSAPRGGPRCSRRSSGRARSCRPWRPTRWTCCRPSSGPPSRAPRWPGRGTPRRSPGRRRCRCG